MKLLASDFDNTLLFNETMKDEDVKKIKEFQKKGHLFGVCTGRALYGILEPSQPYHLDYDFYILLSGALILNKDKDVIYEKKLSITLMKEIYRFLNKQDASIVYNDVMYKIYKEEKDDFDGIYIQSFDELNTDQVSAFSFHYGLDEIEQATHDTQLINNQFGHIVEAYQNNQHIDLAAKGCSKGHGMKMIQDYFHLDNQDMHGIGDSWNDLPMFASIKHSYTFTYAHPDVQAQTEKIVNSVSECIEDIIKS